MQVHAADDEPRRLIGGVPLQPGDGCQQGPDGDLGFNLEAAEGSAAKAAARRLQRQVEQEILLDLQLQGFDVTTPEWHAFTTALAEYGYAVFMGWFISGTVHRVASAFGGGRGVYGLAKIPANLQLIPEDAHGLAADLIINSIEAFRTKTLMNQDPQQRWRPDGGASIKTYFIGRCLMQLPDVYVQWARREQRGRQPSSAADLISNHQHSPDPGNIVVGRLAVDDAFSGDDGTLRAMFELQHSGYSSSEIAEMFTSAGIPMTETQIRQRMSRFRRDIRSRR